MIFKVKKSRTKRHLRNLVRYLLRQLAKSNERVLLHESLNALPMLPGETLKGYAHRWTEELWQFTANERRGKKAPADYFVHAVMSFFPGNEECPADQVTAQQALAMAKEAMAEVAPGERQVLYVVHGDKSHLHVHIAFSVVEASGRIWNPREDFRRWEAAASRLEEKYDLYKVMVGRPGGQPSLKKAPTGGELQMMTRTGKPSDRMLLQQLISLILVDEPTFPVFLQRLLDAEVTPIPVITNQGTRVSGISFRYQDGMPMKGSDLGKGYAWSALSKKTHFSASYHMNLLRKFSLPHEKPGGELIVETKSELPPVFESSSADRSVMRKFLARPRSEIRTDWVWRSKPSRTAFVESNVDNKTVYLALTSHPHAYEALAIRAQRQAVRRICVSGSQDFRKKIWLELAIRGIEVGGYEPSEDERAGLEFWKNEHAKTSGAKDPAAVVGPVENDADRVDAPPGRDAPSECENERGVSGCDVSSPADDDLPRHRESDSSWRDEKTDEPRGERIQERDTGATFDVGAEEWEERFSGIRSRLNPNADPILQLHRVQRLGEAALIRQGVISPDSHRAWLMCQPILNSLDEQGKAWSVTCGKPADSVPVELSHRDTVQSGWASLVVANTLGANIELRLPGPHSWLRLVGVGQSDFEWLSLNEISPTATFHKDGFDEAYILLRGHALSESVAARLVEEISMHVSASVSVHVGTVSFPLAGFDRWTQAGELRLGTSLRFDNEIVPNRALASWLRSIEEDFEIEDEPEQDLAFKAHVDGGVDLSDKLGGAVTKTLRSVGPSGSSPAI